MAELATASPSVLRRLRAGHRERVLGALRAHGAQSRADLGRRTGLSRATLYAIIRDLLATEAVVEVPEDSAGTRGRGRPVTRIALNPGGGLAIGLDLGHRRIHAAIANVAHELVGVDSASCPERASVVSRLGIAVDLVERLAARTDTSLAALTGIGVGVVGPVHHSGRGRGAPRRSSRTAEQIRAELADRFPVPVHVDNNTRLAALAEAVWGSGAGLQNVLYVRLSYGVGGGLVIGGQLFAGATGAAGEVGHVSVDLAGPPCSCGGRGCLERFVNLPAVLNECDCRDPDELLARLRDGDQLVRTTVATAGYRVGRVLAAACTTFNPEAVVIGGELAETGDALLGPLGEAIDIYAHRDARRKLGVRTAALGDAAAARGGIALALRQTALLAHYPA